MVQSHFIVKPNLVLRLGWGFDNKDTFLFVGGYEGHTQFLQGCVGVSIKT